LTGAEVEGAVMSVVSAAEEVAGAELVLIPEGLPKERADAVPEGAPKKVGVAADKVGAKGELVLTASLLVRAGGANELGGGEAFDPVGAVGLKLNKPGFTVCSPFTGAFDGFPKPMEPDGVAPQFGEGSDAEPEGAKGEAKGLSLAGAEGTMALFIPLTEACGCTSSSSSESSVTNSEPPSVLF